MIIFTADDMGLGKTLTMISLILSTVNDDSSSDDDSFIQVKNKSMFLIIYLLIM
jgi:SNF2 family DNA or RNA helicase